MIELHASYDVESVAAPAHSTHSLQRQRGSFRQLFASEKCIKPGPVRRLCKPFLFVAESGRPLGRGDNGPVACDQFKEVESLAGSDFSSRPDIRRIIGPGVTVLERDLDDRCRTGDHRNVPRDLLTALPELALKLCHHR